MAKLVAVPHRAVKPDQMTMAAAMMLTGLKRSANRAIGMPRKV